MSAPRRVSPMPSPARLPMPVRTRRAVRAALCGAALGAWLATAALAQEEPLARVERDGVRLEVWLERAPPGRPDGALQARRDARLRVTLRSALDGAALAGVQPAAWLDRLEPGASVDGAACAGRVRGYLTRGLTERPWRDLTGYHVLLLTAEGAIAVLDPRTNFAGKTSLRGVVPLPGAGFDWDLTPGHERLFVGVPSTRQLAIVDTATLAAPQLLNAPGSPGRVRLHPGGRQVWVGVPKPAPRRSNTGVQPGEGGVWLVDAREPSRHAWVGTGDGHHEFAFDPDGLTLVTNRDSGSVSFVDGSSALERRRVAIGGVPIAAAFDARARLFVAAEAREGRLHRFDHTGRALDTLALEPGLGPMGVSPDGRWLLVLNPARQRVHAVDLLRWQLAHTVEVPGRPFQLEFGGGYAYLRALDREDVAMLRLASLDSPAPMLQRFAAGEKRPGDAPDLPLAAQFAPLPDDSGLFVLSPQDGTLYTYMPGMNAPMGGISPRGHELRAVRVARQGLLPAGRGVFEAHVTLPPGREAVLALAAERPALRHCVRLVLDDGADTALPRQPPRIRWTPPSDAGVLSLTLDGQAEQPWPADLPMWAFRPGGGRVALTARRTSAEGATPATYTAATDGLAPGVWYVHLADGDGLPIPAALRRQYVSIEVPEAPR